MEIPFKSDACKSMYRYLDSLQVNPKTNNDGVHIYFCYAHWRFDVWPTTNCMHITNTRNKEKQIYRGLAVQKALAWYFD